MTGLIDGNWDDTFEGGGMCVLEVLRKTAEAKIERHGTNVLCEVRTLFGMYDMAERLFRLDCAERRALTTDGGLDDG